MDLKKALGAFHARVRAEACIRAFFCSLAVALSLGVALLILARLLPGRVPGWASGGIAAGALMVWGLLYLLMRPTWKQTALRVDGLGLGERIATMVEFRDASGDVYDMQRQDALTRLSAVSPRQIAWRWPKKAMISAACLLALILAVALSPASLWRLPGAKQADAAQAEETEEMLLIREMLQGVSDQIDDSGLSEEEKQALRKRLQELMDEIAENGEMGLAALASAIGEADMLLEDLGDLERIGSIIGELLKTVRLRELALALSAQDEGMVRSALRNLKDQFLTVFEAERQHRLEETAEEITGALARVPGAETATVSSDYLSYCFSLFAGDLRLTAKAISVGLEGADEIEENFRQMDARLTMFLTGDGDDPAQKARLSDLLARNEETRGRLQGGAMDGAGGNGGDGPGVSSQLVTVGAEGVSGGLEEERERFTINETVYDPEQDEYLETGYAPGKKDRNGVPQRHVVDGNAPLSGSVSFHRVYGVYYARLLERLDELPQDSLETVEMYFDGLIRIDKKPEDE